MLSYLLVAFGTILFIWLIQYHWKIRRLYLYAAKHDGPTPLPIIGSALHFTGSNEDFLKSLTALMIKYKSPTPVWLGQRLFYLITDAKHLKIVLTHPNSLAKLDLYKYSIPLLGESLLNAPVPLWKRHRKIIMPTFNQKILDGFVEMFQEKAVILGNELDKLAGSGDFDVFPHFCLFSMDSITETAMGVKVNSQTTDAPIFQWINRALEIMFSRIVVIWYHFDFIFNMTSMSKDYKENCDNLRSFTSGVIRQKREANRREMMDSSKAQVEEASQKRTTLLQQFLELSEEEHLTDAEILDEVTLLMVAASETTASINSFTMMMLGMHPDVQKNVYNEVIDTIGNDKPIEHQDLSKLHYTEMVIKETMRLFPVGPVLARDVTGDIQLEEDVVLPAGCALALGIIKVHRDPKIWPNPMVFDPLRFLPEECAKRHPYSYLPFSGGPRNCIGLKYAMMAMKTVIANLVRKYHIESTHKHIGNIRIKQDFVMKSIGGYPISLERRNV